MQTHEQIERLEKSISSGLEPKMYFDASCALKAAYMSAGEKQEAYRVARQIIKDGTEYIDELKGVREKNKMMDILESSYITLAPDDFHSYLVALEWRRDPEKRFYLPRMSIMKEVADAWTDMFVNDKYDLILFSMPPGVGKLLADDTPVLTTNGWKRHGDLVVGDKVFNERGEAVSVLHVFPKDYANVAVSFTNGERILCHENHEWVVYDRRQGEWRVVETKYMRDSALEYGTSDYRFRVNTREHGELDMTSVCGFESVEPAQGNCIMVEGGVYLVGRKRVATHNSTCGIFGCSWVGFRDPERCNLMSGYADKIVKGFYNEINSIYEDPEYNTAKVFPRLDRVSQSAKDYTMDFTNINRTATKRFQTFTCRSIDGSLTGATRCENLLYCDDLVEGIEEAMNPSRLETLWQKYTNDLASRKKHGCKEIHIGTRWSVHDPIGRLEGMYGYSKRTKILKLPALNDKGKSNFDFPFGVGFSTEDFESQRDKLDDVSWKCLYQQQPIEREGLLFPDEELHRFHGCDTEFFEKNPPDDLFAFVDVAFGGNDYLSMPILAQWGDEPPMVVDWVYMRGDYKVTEPIVYGTLRKWGVRRVTFEANNGGDFYAQDIQDMFNADGAKNSIFIESVRAGSDKSKMTRIVQHSPVIKEMRFLSDSAYPADGMYRAAMANVTSFTLNGKNKNDDAPDSLAGAANMIRYGVTAKVANLSGRPNYL